MSEKGFEVLLAIIIELVQQLADRGLIDDRAIFDLIVVARRKGI